MTLHRSLALALLGLSLPAVAGGPDKVDVCHHTGDGGAHVITISSRALAAHVDNHGDHVVSDEVCDGIDNDCDGEIDEAACTCEDTVSFCSDTADHYLDGDPSDPAVATYDGHPAWTVSIPGATWLWESYLVTSPTTTQVVDIHRDVWLPASATATGVSLQIASDNAWSLDVNGASAASGVAGWTTASGTIVTGFEDDFVGGDNALVFTVTNDAGSSNPRSNPAGLLYCMDVDYEYTCDGE